MNEFVAIAKVCHEVNRAYCFAIGDSVPFPWNAAPSWQKESAIAGVKFHYEHPAAGAEDSHKAWLERKLAEGWGYGPFRDFEQKRHPCCLPFDELPREQQAKDYIFREICHQLFFTSFFSPLSDQKG